MGLAMPTGLKPKAPACHMRKGKMGALRHKPKPLDLTNRIDLLWTDLSTHDYVQARVFDWLSMWKGANHTDSFQVSRMGTTELSCKLVSLPIRLYTSIDFWPTSALRESTAFRSSCCSSCWAPPTEAAINTTHRIKLLHDILEMILPQDELPQDELPQDELPRDGLSRGGGMVMMRWARYATSTEASPEERSVIRGKFPKC